MWGRYMVRSREHDVYTVRGRYILDSDWCDVEQYVYIVCRRYILDSDWCDVEWDVYTVRGRDVLERCTYFVQHGSSRIHSKRFRNVHCRGNRPTRTAHDWKCRGLQNQLQFHPWMCWI